MNVADLVPALLGAADERSGLEWLGPTVTGIAAVLVATVSGISLIWRRRQDRKDQLVDKTIEAQPKVTDEWEEVRAARAEATRYYRLYRVFEELFFTVHSALRFLARKIAENHPDQELDPIVVDALALRPPEDLDKV